MEEVLKPGGSLRLIP